MGLGDVGKEDWPGQCSVGVTEGYGGEQAVPAAGAAPGGPGSHSGHVHTPHAPHGGLSPSTWPRAPPAQTPSSASHGVWSLWLRRQVSFLVVSNLYPSFALSRRSAGFSVSLSWFLCLCLSLSLVLWATPPRRAGTPRAQAARPQDWRLCALRPAEPHGAGGKGVHVCMVEVPPTLACTRPGGSQPGGDGRGARGCHSRKALGGWG